MSVHPSGSGPDRISMCPVRLRAFLLCSCVRRHAYRLALRRLHLEVWRQTDTKAPPPIPPTATCLTAQPGVPETAVCKAPPACMVPLGPRHDGLCWHTPPGAHVAQRPPKGPRRARRCGEACRCLGGCSSSKCCGGTKSCSRGSTVHGERHYCWQCFGPERASLNNQASELTAAQSPAAQWLNAPPEAHPGSCRPCWFTAKGKGCHRNGCLFCHKPHVTADVRHPGGRYRQLVAKRNGKTHAQRERQATI